MLKPETESQSGGSGESTAVAMCQIHVSSKPDGGSVDDVSAADNFGTKVLRISRKFLRRTRSMQDMDEETLEQNVTPDVSVR